MALLVASCVSACKRSTGSASSGTASIPPSAPSTPARTSDWLGSDLRSHLDVSRIAARTFHSAEKDDLVDYELQQGWDVALPGWRAQALHARAERTGLLQLQVRDERNGSTVIAEASLRVNEALRGKNLVCIAGYTLGSTPRFGFAILESEIDDVIECRAMDAALLPAQGWTDAENPSWTGSGRMLRDEEFGVVRKPLWIWSFDGASTSALAQDLVDETRMRNESRTVEVRDLAPPLELLRKKPFRDWPEPVWSVWLSFEPDSK